MNPGIVENQQQKQLGLFLGGGCFALLLAALSTGLSYQFAVGNQLEQLPIILRQLDPNYLANDFFLNTADNFGPRSYFVWLLGFICQWLSLPMAYLSLTWLSDLALVGVTLWVARSVLKCSRLGAALAAVMTLGLASFHLGDATQIRYEIFQPASLALPGMLAAIGFGLQGRPVRAALIAALASLPHPLYGAEGGGIALGLAFVALLIPPRANGDDALQGLTRSQLAWRRALLLTLAGAFVLGAALLVCWWLPFNAVVAGERLGAAEFFHILPYFRAPHHYLPSFFRPNDFIAAAGFLLMTALCFRWWLRGGLTRTLLMLLLLVAVVLLSCLLGTVFAEWWPQRSIVTLQLFRLLSLLKWVGFLLLGEVLAKYLLYPCHHFCRPLAALSVISTGVAQPLITAMNLVLIRWRPWSRLKLPDGVGLVAAAVIFLLFNWRYGSVDELIYLLFGLLLVYVCLRNTRAIWIGFGVIVVLLGLFLAANRGGGLGISQPAIAPIVDFSDQNDIDVQTALAIADHTPVDALLIVPPQFGLLRAIGGRAVVVDFKSIPFQDQAMREWYQRITQVYGVVEGAGFAAARHLEAAYLEVTDHHLQQLALQYRADYALLYRETNTALPVVFQNQVYQLVKLQPRLR